ncbi:DCD domain-containing protein NRP-B-like [Curcuma longa]|uniref:DCD domain-containing protein NRP-B-like n=1 Tax=Curcuma longa TaxID=136217 RepID=UPI003D9F7CD6
MEAQRNFREQASFLQFSDQLRLHSSALANLSIGDSIWSEPFFKQQPLNSNYGSDLNGGWKSASGGSQKLAFGTSNYGVNRYNSADNGKSADAGGNKRLSYSGSGNYNDGGSGGVIKNYFENMAVNKPASKTVGGNGKKCITNSNDGSNGKKKKNSSDNNSSSNNNNKEAAVDKRFKTLPPSEALPRNEAIGGYIFVCNNDTMEENLQRQLFGLPSRFRDSVRAITPGLPLFLYNYSTHQLHGIFESASFGGTNIDPTAWEDKKCPGESRFPAQVRVVTRKLYEPLEEDAFRPILHHYDGPKFRLELNVEEALKLLDIFAEQDA